MCNIVIIVNSAVLDTLNLRREDILNVLTTTKKMIIMLCDRDVS